MIILKLSSEVIYRAWKNNLLKNSRLLGTKYFLTNTLVPQ